MLDVEPFSVSLSAPLETARGTIDRREGFLVFVRHGGERGVGEASPLPGWTESRADCRDALARAGEIAEELDWGIALAKTDAPAARHGIALALADARARAEGQPLYRALGEGRFVPAVPVNATIGDAGVEETVRHAREAVAEGFDCLKIKAGARPIDADLDRIRAVREAVGEDVELRVDVNGAWSRSRAETAFEGLSEWDVSYVEQPLPAEDLAGHARLRGGSVGVALDESLTEFSIEEITDEGAADVVVLKPMVLGGPDRAREIAGVARGAGIEPVVSTTVDAVVARTGAVHVAAAIPEIRPSGLATGQLLASDLAADPAPVADGTITVPQGKGLGLPDRPAT